MHVSLALLALVPALHLGLPTRGLTRPPVLQERPNAILEGVAIQAGEKLVTLSDFERAIRRAREKDPRTTPEGVDRQRFEILRSLWTDRLEEQSGADLGLDPAQIARISRANLEAARDKEGLDAYLAELRQAGRDALSDESDRKQEIFRYLWEQAAQGKAFAAKRATRDQSIRPGELRAMYAENLDRLAPVTVQLRWLIVASAAAGGAEAARASCEDARARVLAGEDLALLVLERGSDLRERGGLTPSVPPRNFPESALIPFCEQAEIGELSEVLPLTNPKTGKPDPELGYHVAQLHDRVAPPLPEFTSPEVQRILRGYFTRQRRERILERERERLRRDSFSWITPLLAAPNPSQAPTQTP